eukprot:CAMPEP_0201488232 /NCGR_PEP_ID=MMETSP0151_2-20130828/17840_1 /ASSEMBLY_ACC=CAM_ASM_000257 /TAXON_ID=200890 /ORGANISM="Paramoeba atlantica, Strain 621/1 / CCAP 1560/9" /LENGTH=216 /DNA_ID=CAMNT_0047873487 /DNA_START=309 /DNA_END=956 /DNA_ORIENTATION=+
MRQQTCDLRANSLTLDSVSVHVVFALFLKVEDIKKLSTKSESPFENLEIQLVCDIINEIASSHYSDLLSRSKFAKKLLPVLQATADQLGYQIERAELIEISPHPSVEKAINEGAAANYYRSQMISEAHTKAFMIEKIAEALEKPKGMEAMNFLMNFSHSRFENNGNSDLDNGFDDEEEEEESEEREEESEERDWEKEIEKKIEDLSPSSSSSSSSS